MTRLVNVSNRLPFPAASSAPGGLVTGVLSAMRLRGGIWFGCEGASGDGASDSVEIAKEREITFAKIRLPNKLFSGYYDGFSNGTLWPLFHSFLDGFRYREQDHDDYRAVNELFARGLQPLLRDGDLIWVHDYHLIPLARCLRVLDVDAPIGFFLHVPFPSFEILRALPSYADLIEALLSYDVIGFQTDIDREAFLGAMQIMWGFETVKSDGSVIHGNRKIVTGVFPIGVDLEAIARSSQEGIESEVVRRMNEGLLARKLIIGVDRLDYSKGILERFEAYRHFLEDYPENIGAVTYLQVAPLGRLNVQAYARVRELLEQSAGRTNGRYATADWTPVRYLNRNIPHDIVMGLLRSAQVCLVTPLRDGMNLVAKEFIAAQDPKDPGVLILSDRAGAACELLDVLLVNPYDTKAIARAIQAAVSMPLVERQARHEKLLGVLQKHDIHAWQARFVKTLSTFATRAVVKSV
jgi:trehalose 6-phosphate synthase